MGKAFSLCSGIIPPTLRISGDNHVTNLNYHQTHFVLSAPDIRHLPADAGLEVAFD